jgi:hypothetical protein
MTRARIACGGLTCFIAIALVLSWATWRSGAGVNTFSEPSLSARQATQLGVFLKPVTATKSGRGHDRDAWQLDEAWLEERVERYEAIPIRKGPAGVRLCVRFTHNGTTRFHNISRITSPGATSLKSDCSVRSKSTVVFAFEATAVQLFPSKGTMTIYQENESSPMHPGQETVSVDYELPGATDGPTTEASSE